MKVKRVGYVGVRTPERERMTWFFRDVRAPDGRAFAIEQVPD